jgi:hypothetical protein
MESGDGLLCRTGGIVEADIDLRGGPDGIGRTRGRRQFSLRDDLSLREVKGAGRGTRRTRDRRRVPFKRD